MPRVSARSVPVVLLLSACAGPGAPAPPTPPAPSASTAAPPPLAASSSAKPADAPPPKPEPLFHAVANVPEATRVFAVRGGVVVSTVLPDDTDRSLGVVDGDKLAFPPALKLKDVGTFNGVLDVRGKLPDALEVLMVGSDGRVGRAERYTLGAKGWKLTRDDGQLFAGVAERDDVLLAVTQPAIAWVPGAGKVRALQGKQPARKLRELDAKACADAQKLEGEDRKTFLRQTKGATMRPAGLVITAAGTVIVVGTGCAGPVAETFAKDATTGEPAALPLSEDALGSDGFVAFRAHPSKEEAWLAGDALLRWDGASFSKVKGAPVLADLGIAKDGTVWGVSASGTELWKGGLDGFTKQPLPEGVKSIDSFAVAEDGTVWLVAGGALFRTKRQGDGASTVAPKEAAKPPPRGPLAAGGPRCKQNMVLLYGFTKVTPDDFDFPKTREAVAGHGELEGSKFVVTKENGKRYFTALVPSFAVAKKLVDVVEKKVQGSKPAILCVDKAPPDVVREVKIDLKTGKVLP